MRIIKRKFIALTILTISLITSVYLIFYSQKNPRQNVEVFSLNNSLNPSLNYTAGAYPSIPTATETKSEVIPGNQNLTDGLLSFYAQEIVDRNSGGLQIIDGKPSLTVPSQETTTDFWRNYLTRQKLSFRQFESKNISVDYDTSATSQRKYLASLQGIYNENFKDVNDSAAEMFSQLIEKNNPAIAKNYTQRMENMIDDLLVLKTPANWKLFHLQYLNLWQKKYEIFDALTNLSRDPIKAMLAAQELTNILEEEDVLSVIFEEQVKLLKS